MNMIEKILAKASGKKEVAPGEVVIADVNLMVMHDLSANFVTRVFREELGGGTILDPSRIAFVFDHNFSPATEEAAQKLHKVRRFAAEHGIKNLFNGGNGSLHHVIIENGLWAPGQVIIGCDSHTPIYGALGVFATGVGNNSMAALGFQHGMAWFRVPPTMQVFLHGKPRNGVAPRDIAQYVVGHLGEDSAIYQAIEYGGPYIEELSIEDRMLFPLMSIDLGAKAAFINPDDKTVAYAQSVFEVQRFRNDDQRRERELRASGRHRCLQPRASGRVSADGGKREADRRGGRRRHRSLRKLVAAPADASMIFGSRPVSLRGKRVHPDVRLQVVPV